MPRTFAIGDIHGSIGKLEDLIRAITPGKDDTLIFLGDYIDRGDSPVRVVGFLIDLSTRIHCVFLRGNHEDMFLEYLEHGRNKGIFFANGGIRTMVDYAKDAKSLSHYELAKRIPLSHRGFYADLRWYYEDEKYIYVHAGITPHVPPENNRKDSLIWIRDEFIFSPTGLEKKVIFGHTPFTRPLVKPDKIGIDTGAIYGGPLTAVELPQEEFIQAE
ncbi:MAG: metallophosphoesterase family protein [Thermodesulfobacteriota bacterium]|nr:metallophosphoesterase family protein [Thermodesulfobacteriota bacterium]